MADGQEAETTRGTKQFSITFTTYSRHLSVIDRMEGIERTVRNSAHGRCRCTLLQSMQPVLC